MSALSEPGVKQAAKKGPPTPFSIPALTLLVIAGGLLVGVTVAVLVAASSVNRMKNLLVEETREEARRAADIACEGLRQAFENDDGATMQEMLRDPAIMHQLEMITANSQIVMAGVLDANGEIIYQHLADTSIDEETCREIFEDLNAYRLDKGTTLPLTLAAANPLDTPFIPVAMPIYRDGQRLGEVHIGISREPAFTRIDRLSRDITTSLTVMSIMVLMVLLATGLVLHYVFQRHLMLSRRAAGAEYLANLGALASGLAHELRNPLYAMNLRLEVAREDLQDGTPEGQHQVNEMLGLVQKQIEDLNHIVTNFVQLGLPARLAPRPMDLDRQVRDILGFLEPDFRKHDIAVDLELPKRMPVNGDPQALRQVLLNVLINAREALDKVEGRRKRIAIRGFPSRKGKGWELHIEDSGPGIPEGEEEAVFRHFIAKRAGGTGLGLSLSRHIIDGHGGTIHAERSELGGARIVIRLPNVCAEEPAVLTPA